MADANVPQPHLQTVLHFHNAIVTPRIVVADDHVTCWLEIPFGDGLQVVAYFAHREDLSRLIDELQACEATWAEALGLARVARIRVGA